MSANDKSRSIRKLISKAATVASVLFIVVFIIRNWNDFSQIRIQSWAPVTALAPIALLNIFFMGMLANVTLRSLGVRLSHAESFGLSCMTRFGNYVAPFRLGLVAKALYLKKHHQLNYANFVSSFSATQILFYLIFSLAGLISLRVGSAEFSNPVVSWGLLLVFCALAGVLVLPDFGLELSRLPLGSRIADAIKGWHRIRKDIAKLLQATLYAFLSAATFVLMTYFEFYAFGVKLELVQVIVLTSVVSLNGLIGITPAGIGVTEGLAILVADAYGLPLEVTIAASVLRRIIVFAVSGLATAASIRPLFGGFRQLQHQIGHHN